jgi:hypothetical protein
MKSRTRGSGWHCYSERELRDALSPNSCQFQDQQLVELAQKHLALLAIVPAQQQ